MCVCIPESIHCGCPRLCQLFEKPVTRISVSLHDFGWALLLYFSGLSVPHPSSVLPCSWNQMLPLLDNIISYQILAAPASKVQLAASLTTSREQTRNKTRLLTEEGNVQVITFQTINVYRLLFSVSHSCYVTVPSVLFVVIFHQSSQEIIPYSLLSCHYLQSSILKLSFKISVQDLRRSTGFVMYWYKSGENVKIIAIMPPIFYIRFTF